MPMKKNPMKIRFTIFLLILCPLLAHGQDKTIMLCETGLPYEGQTWFYAGTGNALQEDEIKKNWNQGKRITSAAYTDHGWFVVMSGNSGLGRQIYNVTGDWPSDWIQKNWDQGLRISTISRGSGQWLVVMSEGTGYTGQTWRQASDWDTVSKWISENWAGGYYITQATYSGNFWTVVMSKTSSLTSQGYVWGRDADLSSVIKEKVWNAGQKIQFIEYGMGFYMVVYCTFRENAGRGQTYHTGPADVGQFIREQWDKGYNVAYLGSGIPAEQPNYHANNQGDTGPQSRPNHYALNQGGQSQGGQTQGGEVQQPVQHGAKADIEWLSALSSTSQRQYTLDAGVKSESRIDAWTVSVNGVAERGISAVKADGYDLRINKTLALQPGDNVIRIEVTNAGGTAVEERTVGCTSAEKTVPAGSERRIALVVGNSKYKGNVGKLDNPRNDAADIALKLRKLGFEVTSLYDGTKKQMNNAVNEFVDKARNYDVALFYYAGHGMQLQTDIGGTNYLIPVDAQLVYKCDAEDCINASHIVSQLEASGCKMRLIVLDACRNLPNLKDCARGSSPTGFTQIKSAVGTCIMYSTREGQTASDGRGRNSPFAEGMLHYLEQPNLPLESFFKKVGEWVDEKTNYQQSPWPSGRIRGDFYFNKK